MNGKEYLEKYPSSTEKPVIQYDLEMKILNEFKSIIEASNSTGINKKSISKCCNNHVESNHGFKWGFK